MAASAWTFTTAGRTKLLDGTFDLNTDTFNMALALDTLTSGNAAAATTWASISADEHAAANGYNAGGVVLNQFVLSGTTTVTADIGDAVWTASGGSIVAHWAVIYETTGDAMVLCYSELDPVNVTVTTGNQLTVQIHTSGVFTLA